MTIRFKNFIVERSLVNPIESMPLYQGHEGIATTADMLDGLHDTLRGKKSSLKTQVQLKGTAVTFGIHPKTKEFFISNSGIDSHSPEEILHNYKHNKPLAHKLVSAFANIQKIMPRKGGMYNGRILHTKGEERPDWLPVTNADMTMAVESDHEGNLLTNGQKAKFQVHPDVYNVNPEMRVDPLRYTPEDQHEFLFHKKAATEAYSKLDPEAFDLIKGHESHLKRYIEGVLDTGEKPTVDGYSKHLMQIYQGRMGKSQDTASKDRYSTQYGKLSQQVFENKKHFQGVINLLHSLHTAKNVLSRVAEKNNNPGDVVVYKGTQRAVLKRRNI